MLFWLNLMFNSNKKHHYDIMCTSYYTTCIAIIILWYRTKLQMYCNLTLQCGCGWPQWRICNVRIQSTVYSECFISRPQSGRKTSSKSISWCWSEDQMMESSRPGSRGEFILCAAQFLKNVSSLIMWWTVFDECISESVFTQINTFCFHFTAIACSDCDDPMTLMWCSHYLSLSPSCFTASLDFMTTMRLLLRCSIKMWVHIMQQSHIQHYNTVSLHWWN